jgi:hypothetical protein
MIGGGGVMLNCLNCGAPFEAEEEKCPYCGTSYYDMSALDIYSNKPFMLKIKTKMNGADCYITQLVRVLPDMNIEFSAETVDCTDALGCCVSSLTTGYSCTTNLTFQAVPRKDGSLCIVKMEE